MGELHDREVVEVHAFEREHGDECLKWPDDIARQEPDAVEAEYCGERSEEVDGVDLAGEPVDEISGPPWQWRVLPVAELPFLAEREILGEVELQVAGDRNRQQGPDEQMQTKHCRQDPAGRGSRQAQDGGRDVACSTRCCDRTFHASAPPRSP